MNNPAKGGVWFSGAENPLQMRTSFARCLPLTDNHKRRVKDRATRQRSDSSFGLPSASLFLGLLRGGDDFRLLVGRHNLVMA